jgi:prevent-host-death family protein
MVGMNAMVSISEAKANFSKLVRQLQLGATITITKNGVLVANLVPHNAKKS